MTFVWFRICRFHHQTPVPEDRRTPPQLLINLYPHPNRPWHRSAEKKKQQQRRSRELQSAEKIPGENGLSDLWAPGEGCSLYWYDRDARRIFRGQNRQFGIFRGFQIKIEVGILLKSYNEKRSLIFFGFLLLLLKSSLNLVFLGIFYAMWYF